MIVCLCKSVNEKKIEIAIEDGAASVKEVSEKCGAGSDCGSCHDYIQCMINLAQNCQCSESLNPVQKCQCSESLIPKSNTGT